MSTDSSSEAPGPTPSQPPPSSLQDDAAAAPESAWFFAWFKSAMLYLTAVTAYLGAVVGLVAAWKKFIAEKGTTPEVTTYMLAGVLALPLLFGLLFNLLPALRRLWERSLRPTTGPAQRADPSYFQTSPRVDDPHGFFAQGYEPFLAWTRTPAAPLLHLTGQSGTGKSSLLSAYLKPHLEAPTPEGKTILLTIRSYHDPLASLKEALLPLWKKEPADYGKISPLEALQRAARQLAGQDRLLVAFDQFEEFFLLRAKLAAADEPDGGKKATPAVPEAELAPLRAFLHSFLADPPERTTLLLSYREDHRRLLAPLGLPPRQELVNSMTIDPFDFSAAEAFLRSCPGLTVPKARMDRVLREAARQEGGRVVMRPIVANLLGLVLRQMSGHPTLWRRQGDLLRGYVRDCLGTEMKEERACLLRALLTDFQTARPRSVADIARDSGLDAANLDAQLDHFGRAGLLRCLNPEERDPAQRVWQIAHDFLATLIERVLDGLHRTLWRTLRPWLAPAAVCLALLMFLVVPWIERNRAISQLANAGFTPNEAKAEIIVSTDEGRRIASLDSLSAALRRMKPRSLDLSLCIALTNVDGLKGLTALTNLNLYGCIALTSVDGLKGLTALQSLYLDGCLALKNVDGLKSLTALQSLRLGGCRALSNVNGLKGLAALQSLNLAGCTALPNVDVLSGLTALQSIDLYLCIALKNVDGLKGLTALQSLNLLDCQSVPKESWASLVAALPKTDITLPDGKRTKP